LLPTSTITPAELAGLPVMARSVVTVTSVDAPSSCSTATIVALAVPEPRASLLLASVTRRPASFFSMRAAPLYSRIGPTLTFTIPRYSSPSTSWSWAPGRHGAMRSTSSSTFHA
jgi:hypothetical protein